MLVQGQQLGKHNQIANITECKGLFVISQNYVPQSGDDAQSSF